MSTVVLCSSLREQKRLGMLISNITARMVGVGVACKISFERNTSKIAYNY